MISAVTHSPASKVRRPSVPVGTTSTGRAEVAGSAPVPTTTAHQRLDSFWRTVLDAALQDAGVPDGTLSGAQFGEVVNTLVIAQGYAPVGDGDAPIVVPTASLTIVTGGGVS